MEAVGVEGLVDEVSDKERYNKTVPTNTEEGEGDNQRFVGDWYKGGVEEYDRDEPCPPGLVECLEAADESGVFGLDRSATELAERKADEVSEQGPDGKGEDNTRQGETTSRKDGREGGGWYWYYHIESRHHRYSDDTKVTKRKYQGLEGGVVDDSFSREERERGNTREYEEEYNAGDDLFFASGHR